MASDKLCSLVVTEIPSLMPKRSNDFQLLVKVIHDAMAKIDGATATESALLREPDGTPREIDILFEQSVAGVTLRLAIECRDRSRPSDVEWIDGLIGKFTNLPIDKVIAVSRRGFSEAAKRKAWASNIELRVLSECITHEWSEEFIQLGMAVFEFKPYLEEVTITFDPVPDGPIVPDTLFESTGTPTGHTITQLVQACFFNHVIPKVKAFVEQEFLAKLPPLAALDKKWEITVPVDVNDIWVYSPSAQRIRVVMLTYLVNATSTTKSADVKRFKYGMAAMATVGTLELDDKLHNLKVVQVAGHPQLSVNFNMEKHGSTPRSS